MRCGECKYSTLSIEVERARRRKWTRHTGTIMRKAEILECGRKEEIELDGLDSALIKEILNFEPCKVSKCIYEKIEQQRKTPGEISKKGG